MPRKVPYSGKQKKQQLQDRKARKKDGPKYLADWSDDDNDDDDDDKNKTPTPLRVETAQSSDDGSGSRADKKFPSGTNVEKMNSQPERKTGLSVNTFRLHFLKESDEVMDKRKKEARRAVKRLHETDVEFGFQDVYPPHFNLDFPKRPSWDYNISKEQLEKQEKEYFQAYLSAVISQPKADSLSYFELNLENWRQMWRVLEMADILLIISDVRYPVIHIPPSLVNYIQHHLNKSVILIVNKIDFVPAQMAVAWKHYLQQCYPSIHVVLFSSCVKKNRRSHQRRQKNKDNVDNGDDDNKKDDVDNDNDVPIDFDPSKSMFKRPGKGSTIPLGPTQLYELIAQIVKDKVDLSGWKQHLIQEGEITTTGQDNACASPCKPNNDDVSGDDVEGKGRTKSPQYKDGIVTLGCIGFPNVGKSSVMNALTGKKVVSVSQTPGHTQHFQTIFLTPTVRLCDCPGLVFPSVVPKALQVIAGIFPVSQVREPYSVVQYLAERMDLPALLRVRRPPDCDTDYQWSAFDICEAWAIKCGFVTPKASRPDLYRAANNILRLAVSGQIRLCFKPPEYSSQTDELRSDPETHWLHRQFQARMEQGALGGDDSSDDKGKEEDDDDNKDDDKDKTNFNDLMR